MNLPSEVAFHASQMYSKNVSTFVAHLVKDGKLNLNLEDEIVKGTLVAQCRRQAFMRRHPAPATVAV